VTDRHVKPKQSKGLRVPEKPIPNHTHIRENIHEPTYVSFTLRGLLVSGAVRCQLVEDTARQGKLLPARDAQLSPTAPGLEPAGRYHAPMKR